MMVVEEAVMPATLTIPDLTEARWQEICEEYSDYRIEYTSEGELLIMAPTDMGTGARNMIVAEQLSAWSRMKSKGVATDSSTGFVLPSGARRSPDAAWMTRARFGKRPACPEFVIEILSPSDRRRKIHEKMLEWLANGAPEETRAAFAKSALTAVTARNAPMGYLVLRVAAIRFGSGCLV
ncbi:MAG: Uma2 family endonuclease [Acidobacteria bacterium]|nr:Uma2 family endonuclease [Acidobacteriota bacterium]